MALVVAGAACGGDSEATDVPEQFEISFENAGDATLAVWFSEDDLNVLSRGVSGVAVIAKPSGRVVTLAVGPEVFALAPSPSGDIFAVARSLFDETDPDSSVHDFQVELLATDGERLAEPIAVQGGAFLTWRPDGEMLAAVSASGVTFITAHGELLSNHDVELSDLLNHRVIRWTDEGIVAFGYRRAVLADLTGIHWIAGTAEVWEQYGHPEITGVDSAGIVQLVGYAVENGEFVCFTFDPGTGVTADNPDCSVQPLCTPQDWLAETVATEGWRSVSANPDVCVHWRIRVDSDQQHLEFRLEEDRQLTTVVRVNDAGRASSPGDLLMLRGHLGFGATMAGQ